MDFPKHKSKQIVDIIVFISFNHLRKDYINKILVLNFKEF